MNRMGMGKWLVVSGWLLVASTVGWANGPRGWMMQDAGRNRSPSRSSCYPVKLLALPILHFSFPFFILRYPSVGAAPPPVGS